MLDSDCFGAKDAAGVLTQADVDFVQNLMDEQRSSGILGPALDIIIPAITRRQIANGPPEANRLANQFLFTDTTPLNDNANETIERQSIRSAMRGNAQSNKHDPDADALFETIKYSCDVLVSNDQRLRTRGIEMGIIVLTPIEMMAAIRSDQWPEEDR